LGFNQVRYGLNAFYCGRSLPRGRTPLALLPRRAQLPLAFRLQTATG